MRKRWRWSIDQRGAHESYQKLADSNNLPVDEVAKMAGQNWLPARSRANT
jgi:uncharacterized protein YdbL (DUF1318 family)